MSKLTTGTNAIGRTVFCVCTIALLTLGFGCEQQGQSSEPASATAPSEEAPNPSAGAAAEQPPTPSAERPAPEPTQKPAAEPRQQPGQQPGQQPNQQPGAANQAKPNQPAPAGSAPSAELSDEKVESYVEVRPKVQKIQKSLQSKIQKAEGPGEANELQQKARQQIGQELADAGLNSKDYLTLEMQLRKDPELQQRVKTESAN